MPLALIPMLPSVGGPELIIFLVIILLLFGAKRIPELARGLGTGVREFRSGTRGEGEVSGEKKDEELSANEEKPETRTEDDARVEADPAEQKRS